MADKCRESDCHLLPRFFMAHVGTRASCRIGLPRPLAKEINTTSICGDAAARCQKRCGSNSRGSEPLSQATWHGSSGDPHPLSAPTNKPDVSPQNKSSVTRARLSSQADVRKRMSLVRRAHPDVSNEVAYVALAQSRGRSSEAAAVLHLPRAKDEAAMVTMMLDITTFISLARQAAETRRRSRQLEKQRRMVAAAGRGAAGSPFRRKGRGDGEPPPQSPPSPRQRLEKERWRSGGGWEGDATDADRCVGLAATARSGNGRQRVRPGKQRRNVSAELLPKEPRYRNTNGSISGSTSSENGGSRGKLQSRRSDSAPSLLPPIEGSLTEGTPPSPGTLKAVLSTSRSVAVKVPRGLGFAAVEAGAPNNDEKFAQDGGCGPTRATRRYSVRDAWLAVVVAVMNAVMRHLASRTVCLALLPLER